MNSLVSQVMETNLADRIFNERQLGEALGGSDARRYALVNRALREGALIRLRRGTYVLENRYRREAIHPFAIAQAFVPGSYISLESALSSHGWIPEAVYSTASITSGRKTQTMGTADFGSFAFHPLALHDYQFLTSVERVKLGGLITFVATPLRALMDLVALRREHWTSLDWIVAGMRIEEGQLRALPRQDFAALRAVYKHKAAREFLGAWEAFHSMAERRGR